MAERGCRGAQAHSLMLVATDRARVIDGSCMCILFIVAYKNDGVIIKNLTCSSDVFIGGVWRVGAHTIYAPARVNAAQWAGRVFSAVSIVRQRLRNTLDLGVAGGMVPRYA